MVNLNSMNMSSLSIATLCGRVGDIPSDPRFPRYGELVEERLEHLRRIAQQLGEDLGDYPNLVFPPGCLAEELAALIKKKEDALAQSKAQLQHADTCVGLCRAYYHGRCNRGVTCSDSHTDADLEAHIRNVIKGLIGASSSDGASGADGDSAGIRAPTDSGQRRVFTALHTLGREAWLLVLKVLQEVGGFESIVVRACDASAARALSSCVRSHSIDALRVLDLSRNRLGSSSSRGVLKLAQALAVNQSLECLSMAYNELGAAGCYAVAEAIASNEDSRIVAINFGGNGIVHFDGAFSFLCTALAGCVNLKKLGLAHNNLGPEGVRKLLSVLSAAHVHPQGASNDLDAVSPASLGDGAASPSPTSAINSQPSTAGAARTSSFCGSGQQQQQQQIECLDLFATQCGDSGVNAVTQFVSKPQAAALRYVNVGWNHISFEGAIPLCGALEALPRLEVLNLAYNHGIGRKGSIAIGELVKKSTTLRQLDLRWTALGDDGAATIAEAMTVGSPLRCVALYGNDLDPRTEAMIVERQRKLDAHQRQQHQPLNSSSALSKAKTLVASAPVVPPLQAHDLYW